jgi:protein arginine N-methyltransferase 3
MVDIHEIMLRDTTRTVTYARFLLSNPKIFEGAIVMDVGCGTGILSSKSTSPNTIRKEKS